MCKDKSCSQITKFELKIIFATCVPLLCNMFTGIIENKGIIKKITTNGSNKTFIIESEIAKFLKIDQSVSHNGVCLTIENIFDDQYQVTAIAETLEISTLNDWAINSEINLERSVLANSRMDGHFVQGHVDTIANCISIIDKNGSWEYSFEINKNFAPLIIEKGSIAINGTSLTIFNVQKNSFRVAIIPYTYHHTNIHTIQIGSKANIEFDMLGKYINRIESLKK